MPVHVVTVNDYLAQRDAEAMGPLYAFFGLSVGAIVEGMEVEDKRRAYACDVTYCTNKELAFDYLRDRMALGNLRGNLSLKMKRLTGDITGGGAPLLLNGLHFAVVDEADSVLVDEARTPLVISRQVRLEANEKLFHEALGLPARCAPASTTSCASTSARVLLLQAGAGTAGRAGRPAGRAVAQPISSARSGSDRR